MAFSIKKRVKSKRNIATVSDDEGNPLDEVLHNSRKSNKSKNDKKKQNQFVQLDSQYSLNTRSSSADRHMIFRNECPCATHYDKQLTEHTYNLTVDKLFDLIFGTNEFVRTHRQAQNIYDDSATDWNVNEETKCRERILNFKLPYNSSLAGKGIITTREKQTLIYEVSGSHYVLETEVCNEGVKFSDTFCLCMRYCLVQTSITTTHFRVTAEVRFCKSMNSLMKQLIERNAFSSSTESLKDLNNRLNLITDITMTKPRLSRSEVSLDVPVASNERSRRMSRHDALSYESVHKTISDEKKKLDIHPSTTSFCYPYQAMYLFTIIIALLVLIHLYLYLKLKNMDILVDNLSHLLKASASMTGGKQ
ncbi:hypothetical protein I4U23_009281 [Adineta vaga]|nr:hypothetical protein I4U23_009281 [Adineta vaga]